MRRWIAFAAWCFSAAPALLASESVPAPNIVFILADDLGYGDLGCYGASLVKTPNLDRLAREGMRFTDAHSPHSVCTPSRYGLLTGCYSWRTWAGSGTVWANDPMLIETGRMTLASLLQSAGYTTACIGKWHLGFGEPGMEGWDELAGPDYNRALKPGPLEVGFDYFFGIPQVGQLPHILIENHQVLGLSPEDPLRLILDPRPPYRKDYLHRERGYPPAHRVQGGKGATYRHEDLAVTLTRRAVQWIDSVQAEPFFLYFAHRNVHAPVRPHPRFSGSPIGAYGDFIQELDWSVGEILAALERRGCSENTLLFFSSDNGAVDPSYRPVDFVAYDGHRANGPFRGQKTEVYEGGHRVPLLARWPGKIPAASESSHLVALTDLLATVAELLEKPLPPGAGEDSFSFLPFLLQRVPAQPVREAVVYDSFLGLFAIRQGPWKLILGQGGGGLGWKAGEKDPDQPEGQLYHLERDPAEQTNLYLQHPRVVQRLTRLLGTYRSQGRSRPGHAPQAFE